MPHVPPVQPSQKTSLTRDELLAWSTGQAFACFGAGFEMCQTHVRTPRIEAPRDGVDAFGNPDGRAIDLLLLDVGGGMDYWILDKITEVQPRVIVVKLLAEMGTQVVCNVGAGVTCDACE